MLNENVNIFPSKLPISLLSVFSLSLLLSNDDLTRKVFRLPAKSSFRYKTKMNDSNEATRIYTVK